MKWYFRFSEFVELEGETFPTNPDVTDKIIKNFMIPLNDIRAELGKPLYIRSCYRPHFWEIKQGRSGDSQHVFAGEGAVDVSLTPRADKEAKGWKELFLLLESKYSRVCYYPMLQFFHCDMKSESKQLFISKQKWEYVTRDELLISLHTA